MIALVVTLGTTGLAGCGSGQITQPDVQESGVNGFEGRVGDILIRDANIAYAGPGTGPVYRPGQSAQLDLVLVNQGTQADTLVSVSSPWAASAQIQGDAVIPAGRAVAVGTAAGADKTIGITLTGLKGPLMAGTNYPVTFTFQRGGAIQALLPIGYPTGPVGVRAGAS
jgi:copper(I)-binding protein